MDAERRARLEQTTRYDPAEVERRVLASWLEGGYFHPAAEGAAQDNFSVAIPPPNVTGSLHMGHALNGAIQDAMVRMRRMQGRNALWVLGTDHAGIGTQAVVEKQLAGEGTSRTELGREAFTERVWEWKAEYGSQIVEQYKRLGASCDYERERFTLDKDYVRAVYRAFVGLHDKGYIYRDNYMVNWDPGLRSAISDLEVENREVTDTLYEIDYPIEGSGEVITVATVRPETMLADTAVAVHPQDERYRELVGRHAVLPLVDRRLEVVADDYIDPEFGTGALKVTPGHDVNDFEIARRHGLDAVSAIGEDGRMTEVAGERFSGLTVAEAQQAVVAALRKEGRIRAEHEFTHSVPFSHRSGERIEPLISLQWFCRMDELAQPAIEVVERDEVRITPEQWKRVYLDWMRNIRPWCVSRQLWWGHRLPVYYCDECGEVMVSETPPDECPNGHAGLRRDEDVLDTWFSSALWPFATLGWPDDTPELRAFYPTSFLTTARDIIYLWVARMIMMGLEFPGDVPFRDVYVHSVIQAPDRRRMSKSLGTGVDPMEPIESHGADATRYGLQKVSSTQDVRYSIGAIEEGRKLATKLWNVARLLLQHADGISPEACPATLEERWILARLDAARAAVEDAWGRFDFAAATAVLYRVTFDDFCDWYAEAVKPRLYDGDEDARATALHALELLLTLLHPLMPHVTEEIWQHLPAREARLVVSPWPEPQAAHEDALRALDHVREAAQVFRRSGVQVELRSGEERRIFAAVVRPERRRGDGALEAELERLRKEIARAEGMLENERFVANAPVDVVEVEREKLARYRGELAALGG